MPTKLHKPLTRRIGDLVVTLTEAGLEVRRPRQHRSLSIPWAEIGERLEAACVKTRRAAFQRPLPAGWLPAVGDRVWINPPAGIGRNVSTAVVIRVIRELPESIVRVRIRLGKHWYEEMLALGATRPYEVTG